MTVEISAEKQASLLPVGKVRRQLSSGVQAAWGTGRKVVLAGVGVAAYVWDGAASVAHGGVDLVDSAAKRGERMGRAATRRFVKLEEQAADEIRKLQSQVVEQGESLRTGLMEEPLEVDDVIEKRIEVMLDKLGVPSRDRLERLSREIDELNAKIDEELRRAQLPSEPLEEL